MIVYIAEFITGAESNALYRLEISTFLNLSVMFIWYCAYTILVLKPMYKILQKITDFLRPAKYFAYLSSSIIILFGLISVIDFYTKNMIEKYQHMNTLSLFVALFILALCYYGHVKFRDEARHDFAVIKRKLLDRISTL